MFPRSHARPRVRRSSGVSRKVPITHDSPPGIVTPGPLVTSISEVFSYPCRIQVIGDWGGLTGGLCWQSHQLPPRHSSWCAARQAEQTMLPLSRFLTASWPPFRGAVLQLAAQPTPTSVDAGQRGFRGVVPPGANTAG